MSREEHNEYMKDVKWTTGIAVLKYSIISGGTLLLAIAGMYYGIKGDIKDGRVEAREMYWSTNHKLDSIQHDNAIEFRDIWNEIKAIKTTNPTVRAAKKSSPAYVTEKYINGQLVMIPIK